MPRTFRVVSVHTSVADLVEVEVSELIRAPAVSRCNGWGTGNCCWQSSIHLRTGRSPRSHL
jgi:hypothetical protein